MSGARLGRVASSIGTKVGRGGGVEDGEKLGDGRCARLVHSGEILSWDGGACNVINSKEWCKDGCMLRGHERGPKFYCEVDL